MTRDLGDQRNIQKIVTVEKEKQGQHYRKGDLRKRREKGRKKEKEERNKR